MKKPDEYLKEKFRLIKMNYRITFISAILFGLCAHLYQFTNKLYNYDELAQTPAGYGCGIPLGRWGLQFLGDSIGAVFGNYSFPMINGLLTLFLIAISACLIVAALGIEDKVLCMLTGGICVTFPVVTSTYFFMFTAPYYAVALLSASLAAYLIIRHEKKWGLSILAVFLLAFATGIYQAYYPVAICICLIYVISLCFEAKEDWKQVLYHGIYDCVFLLSGMILYLVLNKVIVSITGIALDTYQGMENMTEISPGAIYYSVKRCYSAFFALMTEKDILQLNQTVVVKFIFGLLFVLGIVFLMTNILNKIMNKKKTVILNVVSVLLIFVFPISVFFVFVLAHTSDASIYTLMAYPCVFIFILILVLCDRTIMQQCQKRTISMVQTIASWLTIGGVLVCILVYIWFDNGNYQALQYTMYHDLAYGSTIMTQIKSLDGYQEEMPVAIVGEHFEDATNAAGDLMGENRFNIGGKYPSNLNDIERIHIWTRYLGFTPVFLEEEEASGFADLEEVKVMPCYPDDGAIQIVDGTVVIKIEEMSE